MSALDPSGGDVIAFALEECVAGRPAAIVTLVAVEGSAPRSLGTQMAVAADGRTAGSISSGCLERAIIDEACAAMTRGQGGVIRYGKQSRFKDVVLPCGSGIDLLYTIDLSPDHLRHAINARQERRPHALEFRAGGVQHSKKSRASWRDGAFTRIYWPSLKITAAGAGAELVSLSHVSTAAGYAFCAISPDAKTLDECIADEKIRLQSVSSVPNTAIDPWTAFILLFHDREWELTLAEQALASPAFFIGAVGSRKTSAARRAALLEIGIDERAVNRLKSPIGLMPAMRNPSALAVSVLADVIGAWPH